MFISLIHRVEYLRSRLSWDKIVAISNKALRDNTEIIAKLNKDQLAAGRDRTDALLRPTYLNDPYFKTKRGAQGYANLKAHKIKKPRMSFGVYPEATDNTPNLFLKGYYYEHIKSNVPKLGDSGVIKFGLTNDSAIADDIADKYGAEVLGLSNKHAEYFYEWYIKFNLEEYIDNTL